MCGGIRAPAPGSAGADEVDDAEESDPPARPAVRVKSRRPLSMGRHYRPGGSPRPRRWLRSKCGGGRETGVRTARAQRLHGLVEIGIRTDRAPLVVQPADVRQRELVQVGRRWTPGAGTSTRVAAGTTGARRPRTCTRPKTTRVWRSTARWPNPTARSSATPSTGKPCRQRPLGRHGRRGPPSVHRSDRPETSTSGSTCRWS